MLTRFEKARIIGARSLQIAMGAPILVKTSRRDDIQSLVLEELETGVLPLTVIRPMPDGSQLFLNVKGEEFGKAEK
jgi:DNA-directed RNA polymerase subunit K